MAKKKEEKKVVEEEKPQEEKKVVKKNKPQKVAKEEPQEEKESVLKLVAESKLDIGIVAGALNNKGLYLIFLDGLRDPSKELKLTKKEFDEIINEFRYGEL